MNYGITNNVFKVKALDNYYILKLFNSHNELFYSLHLQSLISKKIRNTIEPITFCDLQTKNLVQVVPFINGTHKFKVSYEEIKVLKKIITQMHGVSHKYLNNLKYISKEGNLEKKIEEYIIKFKRIYSNYLSLDNYHIINLTYCEFKSMISDKENSNILIHGDLSPTNILWNNSIPYFIDFDEACFAPALYEYAILFSKFAWGRNLRFNVSFYKDCLTIMGKDSKKIYKLTLIYFIKVIIEKLLLIDEGVIDPNEHSQKKDSWDKWLETFLTLRKECMVNK